MPNFLTNIRNFLKCDARHFQIVFLSAFLLFGTLVLNWDVRWGRYAVLLGASLATQALFIRWKGMPWHSLKSGAITGLGLCLLLQAGGLFTLALGAAIAIAGKFLIRFRGKHVFNPANLGIVAAIVLTGDAWISPGQWGSGPALLFLVGSAGSMVLLRVGRIDTSMAFLITFAALDAVRTVLFLGWGLDVWAHRMTNGSLLLFTFFMITDPMTTPNAPRARIIWSVLIAFITFGMSTFAYVHTAPIWSLFILCAFTPMLDVLMKGERFSWLPGVERTGSIDTDRPLPGSATSMHERNGNGVAHPVIATSTSILTP